MLMRCSKHVNDLFGILQYFQSKGEGGADGRGASKSGEIADKDRVWMRLYQLTEDQLQGEVV